MFVEKVFAKVLGDSSLSPYFNRPGLDMNHLKMRFQAYIAHMTGGMD